MNIFDDSSHAEVILVSLDLIAKGVVTATLTSLNDLLDEDVDFLAMLAKRDHVVETTRDILVVWQVSIIELWDLVQVGDFTDGTKEVVGGDSGLTIEESEPKDEGGLCLQ